MIFSFSFDDASTQETEKKAAVLPTTLWHHLHTWNLQTCSKYVHFKKLFKATKKKKNNKKKEGNHHIFNSVKICYICLIVILTFVNVMKSH